MADIVYTYGGSVYMNITNKCPCACTFCIRANGDGLGSADSLWLGKDPSLDEIKAEIDNFDFSPYDEVIYCGYGEPTQALDNLIESARYIKSKYDIKVRLNSNGLADLINDKPTVPLLAEVVDTISISLNAPTAERYAEVSRPKFGLDSFPALVKFAAECKKAIPKVKFTVVDVITKDEIAACQKIADDMQIPLRVRTLITEND